MLARLLFILLPVFVSPARSAPDWVTVDSTGHAAATITPTVGASSTLSAPPSYLTSTAAYVLLSAGGGSGNTAVATTTATGRPPVASATGPGMAGAFLVCDLGAIETHQDGLAAPFCQPKNGSQVKPGGVYYVTWDPIYFDSNTTVIVAATYSNGEGFATADPVDAATGFYVWAPASTFLEDQQALTGGGGVGARLSVAWSLLYNDTVAVRPDQMDTTVAVGGPTVFVTHSPATLAGPKGSGVPVVAVAVPVVVGGVAFLGALIACVCAYRHHGHLPLVGGFVARHTSSFSAKGYATSSSSPRPAPDPESWAAARPPPGVNVFREELKRQEEERN